jgi:hypothetical protein
MPQFNVQDLEKNYTAIEQLNIVLDFMNKQLDSAPKPNNWSLAPQDANQFILELKKDPLQIDNKLQNFITWCYIIIFNTKKLHLTNQNDLLKLSKQKYQSNALSVPQRRNITILNILRATLIMFAFLLYGAQISNIFKSKKNGQRIIFMISNAFAVSYIRQQLIEGYQLENINTQEEKNKAFLTWLSKIAKYVPTIQSNTSMFDNVNSHSTPNLTPIYRRRLSEIDLTEQDKTLHTSASGLKQKVQ